MIDKIFGNALATQLVYVPYALLYLYAFRKNLRYSVRTTLLILFFSAALREAGVLTAKQISSTAVIIYNYVDILILGLFGVLTVKCRPWRMLFVGLMLKNTADTVVILAKFAESLVCPAYAAMGYHWTYSVSLILTESIILPPVYLVIKQYFTHEIRETLSRRWYYLWLVPFFFYLTWGYVFYFSSDKTDLQLACMPLNSLFLVLSISCQYIIYVSLATLVQSLQNEARLQQENHAMQLQNLQYSHLSDLISEDRRIRHDLRHHFTTIASLVEEKDYDRLSAYMAETVTPSLWQSRIQYCSNTILNIMAAYTDNRCSEHGIECFIRLNVPAQLPFTDNEITILFGNLLENAYEACLAVPEDQPRRITFLGSVFNGSLLFSIENTYAKPLLLSEKGRFLSSKHSGDGIGTSSCRHIVEKHNGTIDFVSGDTFLVNLFFNLPPSEENAPPKAQTA